VKFFIILSLVFIVSCQGKSSEKKVSINLQDVVSKKYYVKGMTCGGCIFGVKTALNKSDELKIVDKKIEVGIATIQFNKKFYQSSDIDCKVTKSIESVTEFKVFLDIAHTKKACQS
jgi:copper chaperone CopZ